MAQDNVVIYRLDTTNAVSSIQDLKINISEYKKRLETLDIGTKEYQETLEKLKVNQTALKNAMYATTGTMEDVARDAKGLNVVFDENNKLITTQNVSYNALVKTMADLKAEWRATTDEVRRADLTEQINEVNNALKGLDAGVGNFQRNVGNYESAWNGLGTAMQHLPETFGPLKKSMGDIGKSMNALSTNPFMGIIGLLAPIIIKITKEIKNNDSAMASIRKGLEAFKPVTDFFTAVLEKIGTLIGDVVKWFGELATASGSTFAKMVSAVVGVGNVIVSALLTPVKTLIEAFKGLGNIAADIFTGKFGQIKEDAEKAWGGIKDAFTKGFDISGNFKAGQNAASQFLSGLSSTKAKEEAKDAGKAIGKAAAEGIKEGVNEELADMEEAFDKFAKMYADNLRKMSEARKAQAAFDAETEAWLKNLDDEITEFNDEFIESQANAILKQREAINANIESWRDYADMGASLISSIADIMEASDDQSEKSAKAVKAIRIAAATIETISGAIGAYMQAASKTGNFYYAASQAAIVTAAGMANIAKIKSTQVSKNGSASVPSATAITAAPAVSSEVSNVRNVTSASEEERLNRMAGGQRVYILQSDIEASAEAQKTLVAEASF